MDFSKSIFIIYQLILIREGCLNEEGVYLSKCSDMSFSQITRNQSEAELFVVINWLWG